MGKSKRDLFLVHPENNDFVMGKTSAPARRVRTVSSFLLWLISVGFLIVTLGLIVFAGFEWLNYMRLSTQGETVEGIIQTKRTAEGEATTAYFFGYEFEVDGQVYTGETRVPEERYNTTPEGASVRILYFPSNPELTSLADHHLRPYPITVIAGIFLLLTIIFFFSLVQLRRRADRLLQQGQVIYGEITDVRRVENDGEPFYLIKYLFAEPETAKSIEGQSRSKAKLFGRNKPERGMVVAVYYADRKTHELL